jgi:hypothetical protein
VVASLASEFFLDGRCGVPHLPHGFGEPLFRYVEFVTPELDLVWFQKTDATLILGRSLCEIVRHMLPPFGMKTLLTEASSSWSVCCAQPSRCSGKKNLRIRVDSASFARRRRRRGEVLGRPGARSCSRRRLFPTRCARMWRAKCPEPLLLPYPRRNQFAEARVVTILGSS